MTFRLLFYSLLGVVVIVAIAVLFSQSSFFQTRLRVFLEQTASANLNGTLHIDVLKGGLLSDISLEGIELEGENREPVVSVEGLSLRYRLADLLFGKINIENAAVRGLHLNLKKKPGGKWNVATLLKNSNASKSAPNAPFPYTVRIRQMKIVDSMIEQSGTDGSDASNLRVSIENISAALNWDSTIALSIFPSSISVNRPHEQTIVFSGELSFLPSTLEVVLDHMALQSGRSRLTLNGDCRFNEKTPVFSLSLNADPVDLSEISKIYSLRSFPPAKISGTVTASGTPEEFQHHLSLKVGEASIETNGLIGFDDTRGLWTNLSASLRRFDPAKLWPAIGGKLSGNASADITLSGTGLQSTDRIDSRFSVGIQGLSAGGISLDTIRFSANWSHGMLAIQQFETTSGENHLQVSGTLSTKNHHAELKLSAAIPDSDTLLHPPSSLFPRAFSKISVKGGSKLSVSLDGWFDRPRARFSFRADHISIDSFRANSLQASALWQGIPGPNHHLDDVSVTVQGIESNLFNANRLDLTGRWSGWTKNPDAGFHLAAVNFSSNLARSQTLDLSGSLRGPPQSAGSRLDIALNGKKLVLDGVESRSLTCAAHLEGPYPDVTGRVSVESSGTNYQGQQLKTFSLSGRVLPHRILYGIRAEHENGSSAQIDGSAESWKTLNQNFTIDKLLVSTTSPWPASTLSNTSQVFFSINNGLLTIHNCGLTLNNANLSLSGNIAKNGRQNLSIRIDNLEIASIPGTWNSASGLSGLLSTQTNIEGSLQQPVISSHIHVQNLSGYGIHQSSDLLADVGLADGTADIHGTLSKQGTSILSATGKVPLDFSLWPFRIGTGPGALSAKLETRDLRFSELPIPTIKGVDWDAVADMDLSISGSLHSPEAIGNITIRDGHLSLPRNKLTYEALDAKISVTNNRVKIDRLRIEGDREGLLTASGTILYRGGRTFETDLTLTGKNFYIPFQKSISARISPELHLSGGIDTPQLTGDITITESKVDLNQLSRQHYSDIQVVESSAPGGESPMLVASESKKPAYLSALSADIRVHVPKNAWLKGQDVNAEIAGDITVRKKPGGPFLLYGPLNTIRGNYYFMGKNFQLTKGNVEFLGLKEINPNLNIEAQTRIKSNTIIVTLYGSAQEMSIDLSSDPAMNESDIISYLVFGRATDDLGGDQAFSVEKSALSYTGGLLAGELRNLLGDMAFIDSFSVDSGSSQNGFGSVTLGKYITPKIFVSHRQGLSENEASYQEIIYELTPDIKLETQIGQDHTSSADITWEYDF